MRIQPMPTDKRTQFGTVILSDGTLDYSFKGKIRLNRSPKWTRGIPISLQPTTYQQARDQSPSSRPIR
jgi:hypothetical protein